MTSGVAFRELQPQDAAMTLAWRTSPRVNALMATDVSGKLEDQRRWLEGSFDRPDYYHWIIEIGGAPAGLISLAGYDAARATSSWGFYVGEDSQLGFGGFIPPHFYNWAFGPLGLQELHAEVFSTNTAVMEMHGAHGYARRPEADRVIRKAGREVQLVAMALGRTAWNATRYKRFQAPFPTALWRARPAHLQE